MFSKGTDSKIKISDKKWYDIVILMAMWQQVCHVDFLACVNSEEYIFDFSALLGFSLCSIFLRDEFDICVNNLTVGDSTT